MSRSMSKGWRYIGVALALGALLGACAPTEDDGGTASGGSGELSGEITISGSSTVEPISSLVAENFRSENAGVNISVNGPGTSDGFELFCNGEIDVADASRPIEAEEVDACKEKGIDFIELQIAIDGISVITSADNTEIECLDFKDLYSLLGPESEGFEQWSDANDLAKDVGAAHAPYPDVPLEVTAPGEESGTYDSFAEIVLEGIAYDERGIKEDDPVIRPDYQSSADDNVIIQGIQGSESSLGWVGFSFYEENQDTVRAIPVAEEGDECVEPTVETIGDGSYPIARDLFVYVNAATVEENAALEAFVDYYLSDEGLAAVSETGYVEQPEEDIQVTQDAWESKETGTRETE
ncbi:MAG: phosphate ABC transporter substrate-binding protein PstS family protein [Actinomycetota bacterium]|nr:phosphate ABC transporter substrate-binding protein PstS family protein [Actinomycetota bacterium]